MCPRVGVWTFCRYCAQEYGCKGCLKAGGELGWGPQSQRLLNQLERLYGSYEGARAAGWRWFARPSASTLAHKHQWWPPQQLCKVLEQTVPLGLWQLRTSGRRQAGG